MNIEIPTAISQYFPYIPPALLAFGITFMASPIIGKFARKFKFIDLPAHKRSRDDKTKAQRIHKKIIPRLGGVAIMIGFFGTLLFLDDVPSQTYGIMIGMGLITLMGILDDKFELSGKVQLAFQLLATLIVVVSGVSILDIQIAGQFIDLSYYSTNINLFGLDYMFNFPADFLTIFWILLIMNALAWSCGIDALGESLAFVAAVTFGALSMKFGNPSYTYIFFVFAGSIWGFIPFNFPTAKILGGTAGDHNYGFFLSTMAIVSGTKLPTAIIILIIPLIDLIWVLIGRIRHNHLKSPLDLLAINDRTHLHHRIMDLGYSVKQTLYLELTLFSIFSILAFYLGGFGFDFVVLTSSIVGILV
ncbi:MAG: UDP-N-acetylmuramyl pentapeptide phosphotransferase/UDP-N-acetylglucosamine-1-phosphate transferase, partial [candidate division WS6 bacterium GW2011_GWA2_37_6]